MLPEIGHKFGPYEILGKLGGGGMGIVFRAWDDRLHREVAIKLLHDEFQASGMRERFLLEARAASALNHPHICTIFDIGEQEGEPFLVMELLEGITLKERIEQGACSSEEIVRIGLEIADALSAAHAKGIVHRDVKPANIFLQGKSERQVKVLDFGLAKVSMALRSGRDSRALELTSAGSTVGTLAYMSPEQARGEHLDLRSDLFSLGIVLYEMATRRTPFRGATTALAFQALLTEAPDPIRTWNVAIPRELERIIMRLLVKDRAERYQTAREVVEALRKLATRGDGDWLRKLPKADVPLVPSADPIARKPRKLRNGSGSERKDSRGSAGQIPSTSESGGEIDFIRPRRMPTPESRPRNVSISKNSVTEEPTEPAGVDSPSRSKETLEPLGTPSPPVRLPDEAISKHRSSSAANAVSSSEVTTSFDEGAHRRANKTLRSLDPSTPSTKKLVDAVPESLSEKVSSDPLHGISGSDVEVSPRPGHTRVKPDPSGDRKTIASVPPALSIQAESGQVLGSRKTSTRLRTWLLSAGALAVLLLGLTVALFRSGSLKQIVLAPKDTILLAPLVNRTGDETLDHVVAQGLEIELTQRSQLHWLGLAALAAGKAQLAAADHAPLASITSRAAAQRLGAHAYLYGELLRQDAGYAIHLDVVDVGSNDRLGSLSETAGKSEDLPAAITRLSVALRARLGEPMQSGKLREPTPLALQATANLAALNLYAEAQTASAEGDVFQAADLYKRAIAQAPDFTLAHLRLAEIYAREGAETAATRSASRALASSSHTGDWVSLLAQISAALLSDQDPAHATALARQLLSTRPHDESALVAMAQAMRSQGHMTEALLTAQQAYQLYPFSAEAYSEAAFALIGLDRFDEALALGKKAAALGLPCNCGDDIAGYLTGRSAFQSATEDPQVSFDRAFFLDDHGDFGAAAQAWHTGASHAKASADTVSSAAGMLAQAAVDRALAARCGEVPSFVAEAEQLEHGRTAAFHIALAKALCSSSTKDPLAVQVGDLAKDARLHSTTSELLLPLVRAGRAVAEKQSLPALAALSKVESQRDQFPTAAYLRGLAHELGAQNSLAIADFQEAARRRGYAFLSRSTVAPLAQLRLANLDAASGDQAAATSANLQFRKMWSEAKTPFYAVRPRTRTRAH